MPSVSIPTSTSASRSRSRTAWLGAVIPNAAAGSLSDIAVRRHDLTDRARAGRLYPPDITGATFTISNLGMFNIDAFSAIITPPQAAVLAVGRIADRVVAVEGRRRPPDDDHHTIERPSRGRRRPGRGFLNDLAGALEAPQAWIA